MINMLEKLKEARELLSNPEQWCKDFGSLDTLGNECSPNSPDAKSFCILGAFERVMADGDEDDCYGLGLVNLICPHLPVNRGASISLFNDNKETTHEQIMELFDKAINAA